ncbi:uncharacterized protein si:ch211-107e6.5 [Myxocyprinus asiaticus]|uniref:uncharacterized protein si:ch211-107e6.5 n=1 Tax=Myxocyprinus asiaticus TaxID=70543 RepID=UPI002223EBDE|nr:uncharacterized protein si:ch211-107e6.5 [Myxocyprinus asiaticus]XP_051545689.1 uncharacterized protein si:ch211-107e6.5 [Myxocyprinus asiaticus]
MSTEMEQMDLSEKLEVIERPNAMNKMFVKLEKRDDTPGLGPSMSNPRSVFRLRINLHPFSKPDLNQEYLARGDKAPSPTASAFHPIGEGHHHCHAYNQERSSQETEKQMIETAMQTKTQLEMDNRESENPLFQKEQSFFRRVIKILLILFIILSLY